MKNLRWSLAALAVLVMAFCLVNTAKANPVSWKGLVWENSFGPIEVNSEGNLCISVDGWGYVMGTTNPYDPTPPWPAYATPWFQMTWIDNLNVNAEGKLVIQNAQSPNTLYTWFGASGTQYQVYEACAQSNWYEILTPVADRSSGTHTVKVGLRSDGKVDYLLDGVLAYTSDPARFWFGYIGPVTLLGTQVPHSDGSYDSGVTLIFTDFQFGDGYTPVPLPPTVLLLGSGLLGLVGLRRFKKG